MKKRNVLKSIFFIFLLLSLIACDTQKDDNKIIQEPVESENDFVSVEKIESYDNMEISDWLDENSVIVSKENDTLKKMLSLIHI